jgi:hypothetical protein
MEVHTNNNNNLFFIRIGMEFPSNHYIHFMETWVTTEHYFGMLPLDLTYDNSKCSLSGGTEPPTVDIVLWYVSGRNQTDTHCFQ